MEAGMLKTTPFVTLLAAALVLAVSAQSAKATPVSGAWQQQPVKSRFVTISNNRGGYVVDYAIRMEEWKKSGTRVRFAGRCQSACTVYLALPASQACIARGASFTFHAPSGSSASATRYAHIYMMKTYPAWVRSWVSSKGGLTRRLVTMNYAYASRFMRPCGTSTASADVRKAGKTG
jgi:hypothetical protein